MKSIKCLIAVVAITACCAGCTAYAQTNSPTIPNFLAQAESWATSLNPNYDWTNVTIEVESGYKQVTGSGAASYVEGAWDIDKWSLGAQGQFFGVGSGFNAAEVIASYALISKHDFRIQGQLLGGYQRDREAWIMEPRLRITKMMTVNTYLSSAISFPIYSKGKFDSSPTFTVGVGFVF